MKYNCLLCPGSECTKYLRENKVTYPCSMSLYITLYDGDCHRKVSIACINNLYNFNLFALTTESRHVVRIEI